MFIVILFILLGITLGYTLRKRITLSDNYRKINSLTAKAATMDTTLPIITQSVGQRYVALSIYHGFLTDFTVPFLVTMWCMFAA